MTFKAFANSLFSHSFGHMKAKKMTSILVYSSICVTVLVAACSPQTTDDNFESTVAQVIEAFRVQDDSMLNALISQEAGLTVIYRMGVFDQYEWTDGIDFEKPIPSYFPYPRFAATQDTVLTYETLPEFDCGSMTWDKTGLFCDTTQQDNKLSQTALNLIAYRGDTIPQTEVRRFQQLEEHSRRVVWANNGDDELIFNLTWIGNRWYLTLIDRVTTDCSA